MNKFWFSMSIRLSELLPLLLFFFNHMLKRFFPCSFDQSRVNWLMVKWLPSISATGVRTAVYQFQNKYWSQTLKMLTIVNRYLESN